MRALDQERTEAAGKLAELEQSRKAVAAPQADRRAEARHGARRLLNSLPAAERAAYDRASRVRPRTDLPDLARRRPPPSGRAAAAVAAARAALGRPVRLGRQRPLRLRLLRA